MFKVSLGNRAALILLSIGLIGCNQQSDCQEVIRSELLMGAKNPLVYFSDEGTLYVLDHTNWKVHHFDQDGKILESFSVPQDFFVNATSLSFGIQDGRYVIAYPGGIYSVGESPEIFQYELPVSETGRTIYPINCGANRYYLHGPISGDGRVFACMRDIDVSSLTLIVQYDSPTDWHVLYDKNYGMFGHSAYRAIFPGWDGYLYAQLTRGGLIKIDENGQEISTISRDELNDLTQGAVLIGVDREGFLYFESGGSISSETPATLYKVSPDWELVWERDLPNYNLDTIPGFIDSSGAYYYWDKEDKADSFLPVLVKCNY